MPCGACGGKGGGAPSHVYQVTVAGAVQEGHFSTPAEARIWIAKNVKGQAATVRAVPAPKP